MTDSSEQAAQPYSPGPGSGDARRFMLPIVLLAVILVAQIVLLYLFTRPQTPVGADTPDWHVMSIYGFGPERLWEPTEVAVDSELRLYVADTNNHRILIFDRSGRYEGMLTNKGQGPGQFQFPSDVDIDPTGRIYVTSTRQSKIVIFSRDLAPVHEIEVPDPLALAIKGERLYVTTDREIMIGDLDGNKIGGFGTRGRGDGQIDRPSGIVVDDEGIIYISDTLNYRVSAYTEDGTLLWNQGDPPPAGEEAMQSKDRTYGLPVGLALGEDGMLYLVDAFNGEIHQLSRDDGAPAAKYGEWGNLDGQLYYPAGITHAWGNVFAVADRFNNRVQLLRLGDPVGPSLPYDLPIWLALLPLLLLPLLPLLARRRALVAEHASLEVVLEAQATRRLTRRFGEIFVTPDTFARLELDERSAPIMRRLRPAQPDAALVEAVRRDAPGLSEEGGWLAAIAEGIRRPRVLTDDAALSELLEARGVTTLESTDITGVTPGAGGSGGEADKA
ncbi:MAG: 6-bladed beta-propeller [Coriobacteriia bacterium]|nr:6-bladed beta-propeller [Coriobacteriia bacterium]